MKQCVWCVVQTKNHICATGERSKDETIQSKYTAPIPSVHINLLQQEIALFLAYVHTHVTCDCDIFAAIIFSYSVHTLVTCDMRPQRATCDMSHEGGEGIGEKWEGMREKLRKMSIFPCIM